MDPPGGLVDFSVRFTDNLEITDEVRIRVSHGTISGCDSGADALSYLMRYAMLVQE